MDFVTLHEVGPRDGLQNEPSVIAPEKRAAFVAALADAGLPFIEVGSFVSPRWVPQMAETDKVMAHLHPGPTYEVLVPNLKGWEAFAATPRTGTYHISVFLAASEGFSQANLNCSIEESFARAAPVIAAAKAAGVPVRGYVSCVTDCPFDGPTPPENVANVASRLDAMGVVEVSLGETLGRATPDRITAMLEAVLVHVPATRLAGHFHDTGGAALDNIAAALDAGLRAFDAAAGGLGGCPYAPGAPGNVATEAVVQYLHAQGYATGVDLDKLAVAADMAKDMRG